MKKIFAVAILLMSLASAAFADGSGGAPPPKKSIEPLGVAAIQMTDGSGGAPPPSKPVRPV
jgi:hypothetical protein